MGYVLVHKEHRIRHVTLPRAGHSYKTVAAAKAALTRARGAGHTLESEWEIMEEQAYEAQVPWVEVTNRMTGEKVLERADTPWHCSVASESYWCN